MRTVYNYNIDNNTTFRKVEDFFVANRFFNEDGSPIIIDNIDTYLSYYDKIKELDSKGEHKELRQPMYHKLFSDADSLLTEENIEHPPINNLATYFDFLEDLIKIGGPKYLRIPIEEDCFEIDTNTRKITAPIELSNNKWTIGVKDDHLAEILWFHINRYHDGQDLAICFPLDRRKEDWVGYGQTYIQWQNGKAEGLDVVVHPEIDEDNIYFGWYLRSSGSKNLGPLSASGKLTFSIRFQYHTGTSGNNQPDLSSPTLFSFNTDAIELTVLKNLTETMKTAGVQQEGLKVLQVEDISTQDSIRPRFSTIFNNTEGRKAYFIQDLNTPIDLDENNQVLLEIKAKGSGDLSYIWRVNGKDIVIPEDGENLTPYKITTTEEGSTCLITYDGTTSVVGTYTVQVGNTEEGGRTRWTDSDPAEMLGPSSISIPVDKDIMTQGFTDQPHVLTVEVEKENDKYDRQAGELTYTWYKMPLAEIGNEPVTKIQEGPEATYTSQVNAVGRYYVEVVNSYNGDSTKPISSSYCTLKAKPVIPKSVDLYYDPVERKLTADVDIDHSNDLYYRWYKKDASYGSSFVLDRKEYIISEPGIYYCDVAQIVFGESAPLDEQTKTSYASTYINITEDEY